MVGRILAAAMLAALCVAGCASTAASGRPSDAGTAARDARIARAVNAATTGNDVTCTYETPVGSKVPRRVCRNRRDAERDRERTRAWVEGLRRAR